MVEDLTAIAVTYKKWSQIVAADVLEKPTVYFGAYHLVVIRMELAP